MCEIDFDEYAKVWNENKRKARKEHQCDCCGRKITKGEIYTTHFSVFSNGLNSEKACKECSVEIKTFSDAHNCGGFVPSSFLDYLYDCISEGDKEDLQWREMRNRIRVCGGLEPLPLQDEDD